MRNKRLDNRPTSNIEMTLIRIGHHIWRSGRRKEWPDNVISSSLQAVWDLKEAHRAILRKSWLESMKKRGERLAQVREQVSSRRSKQVILFTP
jgi:hypothetical protein